MSSDRTAHHAAELVTPAGRRVWRLSWLPDRLLTYNEAITGMVLAEMVTARPIRPGYTAHVAGWAAELGLTSSDAAHRITHTSRDGDHS